MSTERCVDGFVEVARAQRRGMAGGCQGWSEVETGKLLRCVSSEAGKSHRQDV